METNNTIIVRFEKGKWVSDKLENTYPFLMLMLSGNAEKELEQKRQCPFCNAEVLVKRFTCPACGEKIYRQLVQEEKRTGKTKEQTLEDVIRFKVTPKESLASAMRTGTLKAFINSKPAKMNNISFVELAKQSGVDEGIWLRWARKKMQVSRREVNEIIYNIRNYEATVMYEQVKNSWEAPSYGFPAKTKTEREKEKWEVFIKDILDVECTVPSVNCILCLGCATKYTPNAEVLYCPNFALKEAA